MGHASASGNWIAKASPLSSRGEAIAVTIVGWLLFVGWSWLIGKDITFDSLNYHFYLADSVDASRVHKDFFAASLQGYQTPYAYWPLAWMVHGRWPTWLALLFISSLQVACVPALWMSAKAVFSGDTVRDAALRLIALTLSVGSPLVLAQIGGTFIDLGTGTLLLYSVALLLWVRQGYLPQRSTTLAAGGLAGLAVALKLTNAPIAICIPVILLFDGAGILLKATRLATFAMGAVLIFCLAMAYWSWHLWVEYSNPLFPFANEWFRSPDFPSYSMKQLRFVPNDWVEALARPFVMIESYSNIYHEIASPDARFVWIAFGGASLLGASAVSMLRRQSRPDFDTYRRCSIPLCAFIAVAWVVWLSWSGNGRYFVSVLALSGVCVTAIFADPVQPRQVTRFGLLSLLLVQGTVLASAATYRWADDSESSLASPFIEFALPAQLRDRPLTFLTIGKQSMSFFELGAHPDSTWINIAGGMHAIDPGGVDSTKAIAKLRHAQGHIEVVMRDLTVGSAKARLVALDGEERAGVNGLLAAFGVQLNNDDCIVGELPHGHGTVKVTNAKNESIVARLLFCPAHFSEELRTRTLQVRQLDPRMKRIDKAFDELEKQCPNVFGPPGAVPTLGANSQFARSYLMTDAILMADKDDSLYFSAYGSPKVELLGSPEDVSAGRARTACAQLPKFYSLPWNRR